MVWKNTSSSKEHWNIKNNTKENKYELSIDINISIRNKPSNYLNGECGSNNTKWRQQNKLEHALSNNLKNHNVNDIVKNELKFDSTYIIANLIK